MEPPKTVSVAQFRPEKVGIFMDLGKSSEKQLPFPHPLNPNSPNSSLHYLAIGPSLFLLLYLLTVLLSISAMALPKLSPTFPAIPISPNLLIFKSSLASHQPTSKTLSDSLILNPNSEKGENKKLSLLLASAPQTPSKAMRGAEGDAMGALFRERIVFLGNEIDDFIADAIMSQLLLLDAMDSTKDIRLY
ncbi:hypothetical protein HAX54_022800 [Datura stramonium]|uniref:ATP-dependent Clp protease proteolytic subunit n=1 Tax=Datura stramonium TaxID=4076 RepID=A0ABS8UXC7_DATST|nr:hypothetical protein [Datura stramonium]